MLTYKQAQLLRYLDHHLRNEGYSPSFDEMKDALDIRSKSGVHRLLEALEERGFIRRLKHRARAIEVVRTVPDLPPKPLGSRGQGRQTPDQQPFSPEPRPHQVVVPILGAIAAGTPIEAVSSADDEMNSLQLPMETIGPGEHFILIVKGDSMIDAGILDGDQAVIRYSQTAESGQIVAALVDDHDVTLKRLRRRGAAIALEPANPAHKTQIFGADRVKIQGILVTLIRKY